ncbi:MAG TPA: carbohydrate ABC transporter permease [Tepidisphaeraceae bacterium]
MSEEIARMQEMSGRGRSGSTGVIKSLGRHALLIGVAIVMMLPFVWMVAASFKTLPEIDSANWLPRHWQAKNYPEVFREISFAKYYFNSVFVAAWVTFLQVLTSAMAAFAFARLKWRGRDMLFLAYLATLMVPGVVTMIPNYALMAQLHLLDSYTGLILPAAFSAFGTFLLRQFMLSIPMSLDEAAGIDGASKWQVFWDIILPLSRPGLIALAILAFLANYQSLYWPLVLIKSEPLRTLPIGMMFFDTIYGRQTNLIMAASVMNVLPLLIIFLAGQKYLVKGIQLGAVKG